MIVWVNQGHKYKLLQTVYTLSYYIAICISEVLVLKGMEREKVFHKALSDFRPIEESHSFY